MTDIEITQKEIEDKLFNFIEEGYWEFQLGNFMQIFGEHLHKGYIVHAKLM